MVEPLWNGYQPITPPIIPPGALELIQPSPLTIPTSPAPKVQYINHIFAPTSPTAPTPAPTQIPALVPYPEATQYPTYTYTPPAVQVRPLAEVQRAAIDPTLLLLGGVALAALLFVALRK